MISNNRIRQILEEIKDRTPWGVILDTMELATAKKEAELLIVKIEDVLGDIEDFVRGDESV